MGADRAFNVASKLDGLARRLRRIAGGTAGGDCDQGFAAHVALWNFVVTL
jgi:hypothetical protein